MTLVRQSSLLIFLEVMSRKAVFAEMKTRLFQCLEVSASARWSVTGPINSLGPDCKLIGTYLQVSISKALRTDVAGRATLICTNFLDRLLQIIS